MSDEKRKPGYVLDPDEDGNPVFVRDEKGQIIKQPFLGRRKGQGNKLGPKLRKVIDKEGEVVE